LFRKFKRKILISVIFAAVIFLAISLYADFGKLLSAFSRFNWLWLPLLLGLAFMNYVSRFIKWEIYLKSLGIKLTKKMSITIFFASFIMSITPGKMGELLKSYLVREVNGEPLSKTMPIVFAERVTDFLSMTFLAIVGAYVFNYGQGIIIAIGIIFVLLVVILSNKKICFSLLNLLKKIKFLSKYAEKFITAYESINTLLKFKTLVSTFIISGFAWFFECLAFYFVLKIFAQSGSAEVSVLTATFIYCFSTLVGAVAMLPGGLGATEASLTGLLIFLNISKDISAASTIIIRICTLWFAVILGIIATWLYERFTKIKSLEVIQ